VQKTLKLFSDNPEQL